MDIRKKDREPVFIVKSLTGFQKKIADRSENIFRDPILIRRSLTGFPEKTGDRSCALSAALRDLTGY